MAPLPLVFNQGIWMTISFRGQSTCRIALLLFAWANLYFALGILLVSEGLAHPSIGSGARGMPPMTLGPPKVGPTVPQGPSQQLRMPGAIKPTCKN